MFRQNLLTSTLAVATLIVGLKAHSRELPREDSLVIGNLCAVGENYQQESGKLGRLCRGYTEVQICLGYIMHKVNQQGGITEANRREVQKASYCLELFRNGLLGE